MGRKGVWEWVSKAFSNYTIPEAAPILQYTHTPYFDAGENHG